MPFGIKYACEVFQNEEAFSGIPGIHIVANDIIIAAANNQEHDQILTNVMQRDKDRKIVFNINKQ